MLDFLVERNGWSASPGAGGSFPTFATAMSGRSLVLSLKLKLLGLVLLLCLAVSTTVYAASSTYHAVQHLQQQRALVKAGDVRSIRPWMTIPYVAHLCHVPAGYLYRALHVPESPSVQHLTLHALSLRTKRPVDELIRTLQQAIETYRQQHPGPKSTPTREPAAPSALAKGEWP
ncbi:hypothetical protein [Thermogemmatispora carboxidivorans]|uniref:hypothetical protein n=1 Tax=Thermogemmatispora carboxidivorans TaxID=1382306 RepID=UPI00069AE600|nr:hypothetical protein [Thermogemmatispora carboxidivorans]